MLADRMVDSLVVLMAGPMAAVKADWLVGHLVSQKAVLSVETMVDSLVAMLVAY